MAAGAIQEILAFDRLTVGGAILLLIMTVVQISPIKINPWSYIARKVGKALNAETIDTVKEVKSEVAEVKEDLENFKTYVRETDIVGYRNHILRFGDEILCDMKHSKEHFEEILRYIDLYEQYCRDNQDFKNTVTVLTIEKIKSTYRERLAKKDFL